MTDDAYPYPPAPMCLCGHVRRMHGSRAGLILPDLQCRARVDGADCACPDYAEELP